MRRWQDEAPCRRLELGEHRKRGPWHGPHLAESPSVTVTEGWQRAGRLPASSYVPSRVRMGDSSDTVCLSEQVPSPALRVPSPLLPFPAVPAPPCRVTGLPAPWQEHPFWDGPLCNELLAAKGEGEREG